MGLPNDKQTIQIVFITSLEHTVHQNIDKEDLHCVEGVAEPKERAQRDQGQRGRGRTELECQKVLDVMEDGFPCGKIS